VFFYFIAVFNLKMTTTEVRFYEKSAPYYEFSNFYIAPFECDGRTWLTSEHYFQANKFAHCLEYFQLISECDSPLKVFSMARQKYMTGYHAKCVINKKTNKMLVNDAITQYKSLTIDSEWDSKKDAVMKKALVAKFSQHPKLKELLLQTENAVLIEASPRDDYWGEGKHKKGLNRLGQLLMEIRKEMS
jgi:ribA/ribD-fused uncharacterized protein